MQELQDRISKEGANTGVQRLFLLKSLKVRHFLIEVMFAACNFFPGLLSVDLIFESECSMSAEA